jgi:alpha-L-fucosidase
VAGWAPTDTEIGDLLASGEPGHLARVPYTEWYENSLRFPGSPVARHHREVWGDRPYAAFAEDWEAGLATWDPRAWAEAFRAAGARYVVLVAKHHDGWCLWPTEVRNPHRPGWHARRDVVGELAAAVRRVGLRFGLYYSGGLDWTFEPRPVGSTAEVAASIPQGDYPAYAEAQVRELIERYRPSVLWNDIAWPGRLAELTPLIDHYRAVVPDGVVNDRWTPWSPAMKALDWAPARRALDWATARAATRQGGLIPPNSPVGDVRTPEYLSFDEIRREPWECVRGMDRSFGFNRASAPEHFVDRGELLAMAVDIASKGGNLLLNVGPRGEDAQIPDEQLERLGWLGELTSSAGDALYTTRPWVRAAATTVEGDPVRFTARGEDVFAHVLADGVRHATVPGLAATPTTDVRVADRPVDWRAEGGAIRVDLVHEVDRPAIRLHAVEAR